MWLVNLMVCTGDPTSADEVPELRRLRAVLLTGTFDEISTLLRSHHVQPPSRTPARDFPDFLRLPSFLGVVALRYSRGRLNLADCVMRPGWTLRRRLESTQGPQLNNRPDFFVTA